MAKNICLGIFPYMPEKPHEPVVQYDTTGMADMGDGWKLIQALKSEELQERRDLYTRRNHMGARLPEPYRGVCDPVIVKNPAGERFFYETYYHGEPGGHWVSEKSTGLVAMGVKTPRFDDATRTALNAVADFFCLRRV
jgi:hypothetical protein